MTIIKLGAAALALTLSLALPVESPTTAQLFGAPAAHAGVWGSIKGAAKKVGGAAKDVGKVYKNFATDTAKHAKRAAGTVGSKAKGAAKTVGRNAAAWGKHVGTGTGDIFFTIGKGVGKTMCAFQCDIDHKFNPPGLGPNLNQPLPKPPAGQPGSWGGSQAGKTAMARPLVAAPNQGIAKPNLGIARDKSVWGRPVGVSTPKSGSFATKDIRPMAQAVRSHRR